MVKKVVRYIKDGLKLIAPTGLYLAYYAKKHDDEYRSLMDEFGAPEYYKSPEVKKDYFKSLALYGLPVRCYKEFGFYEIKNKKQRNSFVGYMRLMAIWNSFNHGPSRKILDDKVACLKVLSEYVFRDWIYVPEVSFEMFKEFCLKHPKMLVKKRYGYGGQGIHVFKNDDLTENELKQAYDKYVKEDSLIEEYINQTGILHDLNPDSVNSIRICTMRFRDHTEVFQSFLKIGRGNVCVDNISSGGMLAPIDIDTGIITGNPYDDVRVECSVHPVSGIKAKGIQIPYWNDVKRLVIQASEEVKDLLYVSWDVAVCDDGRIYIIEANSCGSGMLHKDCGEWDVFERAIKDNHKLLRYKLAYNYALKMDISWIMSHKYIT